METKKPRITIIVPAYNEGGNLKDFRDCVDDTISGLDDYIWEFLFVDDGSSDDTWMNIEDLSREDPRVRGISLTRNFGKENAMTAGAESLQDPDAAIFMDADLQHPPSLIPEMLKRWKKGYQIVATHRTTRHDSWVRELGTNLFYYFINRYSDLNMQPKATDFRLLDRQVLKVFKTFRERNRFFRGIVDWMGFQKTFISFSAPLRRNGKSTFNYRSLYSMAINSFTSFSLVPLRITGYVGLFVIIVSFLLLIYMFMAHLILHLTLFTPMAYFVVCNTLLFGVVLAALGMIALYIGHIHTEVIGRPMYIVKNQAGFMEK